MSLLKTTSEDNFDETGISISPAEQDTLQEVLAANRAYVEHFGDKATLVGAPRRRMAILTCMDARMDPAKFIGLREGDAHVIRNAGGRATDDAIRSLVVSCKLMGTTDWFVIHHTGCGMQSYTDEDIRQLLNHESEESHQKETKWWNVSKSARTAANIEWLTFSDLKQSIIDDVGIIRKHPLVPPSVAIYGYIYHVHHGTLEPVPEANRIGAPKERDSLKAATHTIMKKKLPIGVAITGLLCLTGCAFHHHEKQPAPMPTYVERPPANTIEPRFDGVSPTTY